MEPPTFDTDYRCQAFVYDRTGEYVVIVHENSTPLNLRKWGLPKGKLKLGETERACIYREIREEISVDLHTVPHNYQELGELKYNIKLVQITINLPKDEIHIKEDGVEILEVEWVKYKDLVASVKNNSAKYNSAIKNAVYKNESYNNFY